MNISNIDASKALNFFGVKNGSSVEKIATTVIKGISDAFSQSDETTKFKNIVDKYDITNISQNDAKNMYKELYDNNLIRLKDMLVTFDSSKIPGFKDKITTISGSKISSNPDEKINLLEQLKKQADYNKQNGDKDFQETFNAKLHLAEKIYYFQT